LGLNAEIGGHHNGENGKLEKDIGIDLGGIGEIKLFESGVAHGLGIFQEKSTVG
jgi:hypothetical protein